MVSQYLTEMEVYLLGNPHNGRFSMYGSGFDVTKSTIVITPSILSHAGTSIALGVSLLAMGCTPSKEASSPKDIAELFGKTQVSYTETSPVQIEDYHTSEKTLLPPSPTPTKEPTQTHTPTKTPTSSPTVTETSTPSISHSETPSITESDEKEGSVYLRDSEKWILKYRNDLLAYMKKNNGEYPKKIPKRIPAYFFYIGDDPDSVEIEKPLFGITHFKTEEIFYRFFRENYVSEEHISACLDAEYWPFLEGWEDAGWWTFELNIKKGVSVQTISKECGFTKEIIDAIVREGLIKNLKVKQEIQEIQK